MSFRLFIYYGALCGGVGAFAGWAVGRWLTRNPAAKREVFNSGVKGLFLGVGIAALLGLTDAPWNFSLRRFDAVFVRVLMALVIGGAGGLLGGMVGQWLVSNWNHGFLLVLRWTLTGLLIGMSVGVIDLLPALLLKQATPRPPDHGIQGRTGRPHR